MRWLGGDSDIGREIYVGDFVKKKKVLSYPDPSWIVSARAYYSF